MMPKRSRERFARMPVDVLESAACATLPLAAFKVLTVLASSYSGANNGTLACTESWARRYGINGTDTVRRSLKELERRGLIEVTRRGMRMRRVPTLYAITWASVDNRDGTPIGAPAPASHRYAQYDGHAWDESMKRWIEKKSHPYGRGDVTPGVGVEASTCTPIRKLSEPVFTPARGETLDLGQCPDERPITTTSKELETQDREIRLRLQETVRRSRVLEDLDSARVRTTRKEVRK